MTILINGELETHSRQTTAQDILKQRCGDQNKGVAIAKNGSILHRDKWNIPLNDGDELEIIVASQGG